MSESFLGEKSKLLREVNCNPFDFVCEDEKRHPEKFVAISGLAKRFQKKATEQINSTRGDIFTQCIAEMYRLMNLEDDFDDYPPPLSLNYLQYPALGFQETTTKHSAMPAVLA